MTVAVEPTRPIPSDGRSVGRRLFLFSLAVVSLFLSIPSSLRAFFIRSFPVRTVEKDTFRFDPKTGMVLRGKGNNAEPYGLLVDGLVERPLRLTYDDLTAMPRVTQVSDFHCVEGWSVKDVSWGGIRFDEIARRAGVRSEAKYAVFHALGETSSQPGGQRYYVESFPVSHLLDPKKGCLLALTLDGKPLPHEHGAPCRVVSPYDLAYKSIKYVTRIEFSRSERAGWWTLANPIYPMDAPVPADRLRKKQDK